MNANIPPNLHISTIVSTLGPLSTYWGIFIAILAVTIFVYVRVLKKTLNSNGKVSVLLDQINDLHLDNFDQKTDVFDQTRLRFPNVYKRNVHNSSKVALYVSADDFLRNFYKVLVNPLRSSLIIIVFSLVFAVLITATDSHGVTGLRYLLTVMPPLITALLTLYLQVKIQTIQSRVEEFLSKEK